MANLLCQAFNLPLNFTWENGDGMPLREGGTLGLEFSEESRSLSYVVGTASERVDGVGVACIANRGAGEGVMRQDAMVRISVVGKPWIMAFFNAAKKMLPLAGYINQFRGYILVRLIQISVIMAMC